MVAGADEVEMLERCFVGKDFLISFVFQDLLLFLRILDCAALVVGRVLLSERSCAGGLFHFIRRKGWVISFKSGAP